MNRLGCNIPAARPTSALLRFSLLPSSSFFIVGPQRRHKARQAPMSSTPGQHQRRRLAGPCRGASASGMCPPPGPAPRRDDEQPLREAQLGLVSATSSPVAWGRSTSRWPSPSATGGAGSRPRQRGHDTQGVLYSLPDHAPPPGGQVSTFVRRSGRACELGSLTRR